MALIYSYPCLLCDTTTQHINSKCLECSKREAEVEDARLKRDELFNRVNRTTPSIRRSSVKKS